MPKNKDTSEFIITRTIQETFGVIADDMIEAEKDASDGNGELLARRVELSSRPRDRELEAAQRVGMGAPVVPRGIQLPRTPLPTAATDEEARKKLRIGKK
jgi:hypothetical protein